MASQLSGWALVSLRTASICAEARILLFCIVLILYHWPGKDASIAVAMFGMKCPGGCDELVGCP